MSTSLDCHIDRGSVVFRVGDAALPAATVQPELPGSEYVRVFDLVHAAVLRWSPNVLAAVPDPVPGLSGDASDCPVEDAIDALTYAIAVHRAELASDAGVHSRFVEAVSALAAGGSAVPGSAEAWAECLRQSLEIYEAVNTRSVRRLAVHLEAGRVQLSY